MAGNTRNNNSRKGNNRSKASTNGKGGSGRRITKTEPEYTEEIYLNPLTVFLAVLCVGIFMLLCNIGILGEFGKAVNLITYGIFGALEFIFPVVLVFLTYLGVRIAANPSLKKRKVIASAFLYCVISMLTELFTGASKNLVSYSASEIWTAGSETHVGGGIIFGSLAFILKKYLSQVGAIIILFIIACFCMLVILGRNTINSLRENSARLKDASVEAVRAGRERIKENEANNSDIFDGDIPRYAKKKRGIVGMNDEDESEEERTDRSDEVRGEPLPEVKNVRRMDKKVSGTMEHKRLDKKDDKTDSFDRDDIHEITVGDISEDMIRNEKAHAVSHSAFEGMSEVTFNKGGMEPSVDTYEEKEQENEPVTVTEHVRPKAVRAEKKTEERVINRPSSLENTEQPHKHSSKAYKMPPISLLNKSGAAKGKDSKNELLETAAKLQATLENFGVKAKVLDISQGPSVTRFELQPEVGVRVNKIVSLADDIKLSLAAADIRIEAPIPGKSAVGIEVPNKESTGVGLRELIEDKSFKDFDSKIAIAIGKDIAGKTIVADIAKMPHMLIAGATGSGKSVCINTIIMSILYKAHPDEVKLIMVDPKVVELSVYNGIPHLMVPVVTDPKKAAAALNWGVAEMTERYRKFADFNVRDLKGYNAKIESILASGRTTDDEGNEIYKLPQIVIIVDELADLMMVAAKEVEESICRIAQLARACGIHLIIATQRPSVDVITGLIKANMPSRVAFAVSSGIDSRTILDMNGAEKLLGKGDMLFFPQGYPKPARVQGAFVSDVEVSKVVEFLKDQDYVGITVADIENKISNMSSSGSSSDASGSGDDTDDLFTEAGRFIINQDKASIGSLQRKFKIGFNRAARIMDQLAEAGVVSEENGTKPREILMSIDAFEQYVEDYV